MKRKIRPKIKKIYLNNFFSQLLAQPATPLSGPAWAKILKILNRHESQPGGPYYNEAGQLDLSLNLKIAYFLKSQKIVLPELLKFIRNNQAALSLEDQKIKKLILTKIKTPPATAPDSKISRADYKIYRKIISSLRTDLSAWPTALGRRARLELKALIKSDSDYQIGLLPLLFKRAQKSKLSPAEQVLVIKLGRANFYLWLAYNIYDDLLDENDREKRILLPIANSSFKNFLQIFSALNLGGAWDKFFNSELINLEAYNYQEVCEAQKFRKNLGRKAAREKNTKTALGALKNLNRKSIAHAFGPLALLSARGYEPQSSEFINLLSFFRNYLNARQLADDLHDWPQDLQAGRLNGVIYYLTSLSRGRRSKLPRDLPRLQKIFFKQALKPLNKILLGFCSRARQNLNNSFLIISPGYLTRFLEPLELSAQSARRQQNDLRLLWQNLKKSYS